MKKVFILLLFLTSSLNAQITNAVFFASCTVLPPLPNGITSATITPSIVNSNGFINIFAKAEGNPTNIQVYFSHQSGSWSLVNIGSNWETGLFASFKNQSIYTANFVVIYTNYTITNYNRATYIVDNEPPRIVSSDPTNGRTVDLNTWHFELRMNDPGLSGIDYTRTIANSKLIYEGTNAQWTNNGRWTNDAVNQITFFPSSNTLPGYYRVITFPVDNVGNTNLAMLSTNQQIRFIQSDTIQITIVCHKFKRHTQLTPGVPFEVTLRGTAGRTAWFEVLGITNIRNINMSEVSNGVYRATYIIRKSDYITDGRIRGYLQGQYGQKYFDCDIPIDIGERVLANRGKDIFIVSPDDVETKLLIPDKSLKEDAKIEIKKIDAFGDKYAYDFNMTSYANNAPMQYFDKPLTIFIHYNVNNEQVEKLNIPETELSKKATLLFHDRVRWSKVGGVFDTEEKVIKGNVKHFSVFALGIDDGNNKLIVHPNPFTPNSDADNDRIHFDVPFLQDEPQKVEIRIYSMDGFLRKIFTEKDGTINNNMFNVYWDGKESNSRNCDAGLYIYQAQIGNRRFQGTFVLAR